MYKKEKILVQFYCKLIIFYSRKTNIENEKKIQIVVFETHCKMSSVYMHLKKEKGDCIIFIKKQNSSDYSLKRIPRSLNNSTKI